MFTGIIEELGTVERVGAGRITVRAQRVLEGTRLGDSIAVNGVCLTVTHLTGAGFTADVMPETLRRSSLGQLRPGSRVNLERAMAADGRFGGHIVSGHIDGMGQILALRDEGNAVWITIAAPHCGKGIGRHRRRQPDRGRRHGPRLLRLHHPPHRRPDRPAAPSAG